MAKEFFPSLARLGRIVKPLWLKTHSAGAYVPETERETFFFPAVAAVLQFQPSAATTDQELHCVTDHLPSPAHASGTACQPASHRHS